MSVETSSNTVIEKTQEGERVSREGKPKYWDKFNKGFWTQNTAANCNRARGCLLESNGNNTKGMVRCDGCSRWTHIICLEVTDFDDTADFLCIKLDDLNMEQMEMNVEMIKQLMDMNVNLGLL